VPTSLTASTVALRRHPLERALAVARELGFASVDLAGLRGLCEHVPILGTAAELAASARVVRESGLRPASVNADPGSFDVEDAAVLEARIARILDYAVAVEAPLVVLPCGEKTDDAAAEPRWGALLDGFGRAADRAEGSGVRIAVEAPYFGRPIDSRARAERLFDDLDPRVQVAYDVSHVRAAGDPVTETFVAWADRIAIVHLRDAVTGDIRRVIGRGDVDFAALFAAVRAHRPDLDVVLELETRDSPYPDRETELLAAVAQLDPQVDAPGR
jgi:sugar phosphate isomerase/epimerase